jgi:choline-sulfatase
MRTSLRRIVQLACAVALMGVLWHAWRLKPVPVSVVIITLDTTRADRLTPYGLMDTSMPALERLAAEGVVFDQATTVAPLTLPAHTSLFTGLIPPHHGVIDNAAPALADRQTTLAEVLRARGLRTAAFVGSVVLDVDRGLAQGFEEYRGVPAPGNQPVSGPEHRQRRADKVIDEAVQWLDGVSPSPFFLWAHLYDAHRPYDPPDPFASSHADPYIGEIAFASTQIGRLVEALERRGLLDRTIVVVAGDHGESLGDHGERDHGIFVYESVMRVPLIIRAPGIAPRRVGSVVRLTDVMPTVLTLLSIPSPATDGVSLADLLSARRTDLDLEAYSESLYPMRLGWSPLHALRAGRYKIIDAPRPELYDLDRDPFEERNVYGERPDVAAAMTRRVRDLARGETGTRELADVPAELQARLAALGYVSANPRRQTASTESAPDPKDCIGLYRSRGQEDGGLPTAALACR